MQSTKLEEKSHQIKPLTETWNLGLGVYSACFSLVWPVLTMLLFVLVAMILYYVPLCVGRLFGLGNFNQCLAVKDYGDFLVGLNIFFNGI